jgi:hypothetical protein
MRAAGWERARAARFAAAGALCAWACQAGDANPFEALASGQAPAELRLCPGEAPDDGGCSAACGDLQATGRWSASDGAAAAAVVELADELVVFGDRGAAVFQGGARVSGDPSVVQWAGAAALPAADGPGTWAVGIASDGQLWRVTRAGKLEAISDRFGLAREKVLGAAAAGGRSAGFALESGLAVSDGMTVRRYDVHPSRLAAGAGALAWTEAGEVRRLEVATGALTRWRLPGARAVALAQDGRLAVLTEHELWAGPPNGELALVYRTPALLGAAVACEGRFWFLQGGALGSLAGDSVAHTAAPLGAADAALAPASDGGVWILSGGAAQKWTEGGGEAAAWQRLVQPAYARLCASCHQAGEASLPLASARAWRDGADAIRARVLRGGDGGTMPPASSPQPTGEELQQLRCWLDGAP